MIKKVLAQQIEKYITNKSLYKIEMNFKKKMKYV